MDSVIDRAEGAEGGLAEDTRVIESSVLVETADRAHLLNAQVEVEDRDILDEALNFAGFRDGSSTSLNSPSEQDLGRSLGVSCSDLSHLREH